MTTKASTYPLRLPLSLKRAVEKLSKQDGTSIAFRRILNRKGGEPPHPGDEL